MAELVRRRLFSEYNSHFVVVVCPPAEHQGYAARRGPSTSHDMEVSKLVRCLLRTVNGCLVVIISGFGRWWGAFATWPPLYLHPSSRHFETPAKSRRQVHPDNAPSQQTEPTLWVRRARLQCVLLHNHGIIWRNFLQVQSRISFGVNFATDIFVGGIWDLLCAKRKFEHWRRRISV